jgi:hypothetical protein
MTTSEGKWITVGGPVDETEVSILFHGDFDPQEITKRTGIEPNRHHRKGEVAAPGRAPYPDDYWSLELKVVAPDTAEDGIWQLLTQFPMNDDFWESFRGTVEVFICVVMVVKAWNRGFRLSSMLLKELDRRSVTLDFSIYAEPQPQTSACLA